MFGVEALPLIHSFAQAGGAPQRALFMRVYLDVLAESLRRGEDPPPDWFADLQACLAHSAPGERDGYLTQLAKARAPGVCAPAVRRAEDFSGATREDIEQQLRDGSLDCWIGLARDRSARLRSDHIATLVARACVLVSQNGDRRLVEAILSRTPVRLEAAPLFLEASSEHRWAILLAAQRADLGRKVGPAPKLAAEIAGQLEFAAIAGDLSEFAEALGAALGVETELAQRLSADPAGEPLAVALAALGAPRDLSVRIMTARDMRDGDAFARIHTLARLSDRLSPNAARRIVQAIAGQRIVAPPAPLPVPPPRQAEHPSPFLRREIARTAPLSPETTAHSALNSRRP